MSQDLIKLFSRVKLALLRRGRAEHEAEDLVQEAWVRLACYEQKHVVEKREAFLMRAALNLSVDEYRAKERHGEIELTEEIVAIDLSPSPEAAVLANERLTRLTLGLSRLDARTRDIFLAHRLEGLTYSEIAQRFSLSVSSVEKYIAKATLVITAWMEGW